MDSILAGPKLLLALLGISLAAVAHADIRGVDGQTYRAGTLRELTQGTSAERLYIVQFRDPPALGAPGAVGPRLVTHGLLAGGTGQRRFDPESSTVRNHVRALQDKQDALLRSLNLSHKQLHSYRYTFNGVAVKMSPQQADALRLHKSVKNIWEDKRRRVSTVYSPGFLGLLDTDGGLRSDLGLQGDDIIIGVIDSGITPNHPSFADRAVKEQPRLCRSEWGENSLLGRWLCRRFKRPGPALFDSRPAHWRGACETGANFTNEDCNKKLIGARFYNDGFLFEDGYELDENEFDSPADADGHGTHIASIAAGNAVEADVFGRAAGRVSGIAPRARVAAYKACWLQPGAFRATCSVADLVLAIDDAVADGVDIINYSVGSLDDSLTDPDDLALLRAAESGVLTVVATGNSGPEPYTMEAPGTNPWVLSVGASSRTGSRIAEGLRVNKPASLAANYESKEASFTPTLAGTGPVTADLVLVDDNMAITPEGEIGTALDACSELVNTEELSGAIAYIQRGGCDFEDKIRFAQDAGAVAVVVFSNDNPLQVMAGDSAGIGIPAVMIGQADGQLLRDKLTEGEAVEVTLDKSIFINFADAGNVMGSFSGRGPTLAGPARPGQVLIDSDPMDAITQYDSTVGSDFLKPDVVAPGVRILGGQSPSVANGFRGEDFQYLSGTSQSAPHVAGLAALIKQQHPDWTPAEIKSSLMTTARQDILKEAGGAEADPFDMGAGHVVPNNAVDPGLLYDTAIDEYDAYLCKQDIARITAQECAALMLPGLDAKDINLPSIALTELVVTDQVTRTVRNPGPAATFAVEVVAPPEVQVVVSPDSIMVGEDSTATFTVSFTTDNAPLNEWLFGSYTWISDSHRVRSPFAVRPAAIAWPAQVNGDGTTGNASIDVRFGYNGGYDALALGLEQPCVLPDNNLDDSVCTNTSPATVSEDSLDFYRFEDGSRPWVERLFINVDADDDLFFRVSLFDELTAGNDDLDLYVWYCLDVLCENVEFVGAGQHEDTSDEGVDVYRPEPGTYIVDVHGFNVESIETQFCVLAWGLGRNDTGGNLTLSNTPGSATQGSTPAIIAGWNNLADGLWLGGVLHRQDAANELGLTLIDVDVNGLPVQNPGALVCP